MKNIGSQYLVALLSISLAGIIGLQIYLFNNSITVKEAQFNRDAVGVLQSASHQLEDLDAMRFIDEQMGFKPWLSSQIEEKYSLDSNGNKNVFAQQGNLSLTKDTFFVFGDGKTQARMHLSRERSPYGNAEQLSIAIGNDPVTKRMERKMNAMDSVFHNMVNMGMRSAKPITERFTKNDVDSVIKSELSQYNIKTNFEYAVIENGFITHLRSEKFVPSQADFRIPIFRNDFFAGPKWLVVNFPEKSRYVLKSLWLMFVLSVLFTVAIVLTFWRTLYQMQKQKRISQIKSDFINNMTHEFKTPIATISLAVDALNNPKVKGNAEKLLHYSEVIRTENKRMHTQVENVLKLAMLDKKELELNKDVFNLNTLVQSTINHFKLTLESKGGVLNSALSEMELTLEGDPTHIENVLINIVDNAIKYSEEAPVIDLKSFQQDNWVFVEIKDQGRGMTPEVRKQIFERFYREERGNIHNVKGHGLGLSYAIKIVRLHGGDIVAESKLGQGSTFIIKLPKYESN